MNDNPLEVIAEKLRQGNFEVVIVDTGAKAKTKREVTS